MAIHPTFVAYIDESGDEGFRFGAGSSAWFVLAAVVLRREKDRTVLAIVDEIRDRLNQDRKPEYRIPAKKPLHFRDLKHEQRKFFADRIARAEVSTVSVMVHKPDLTSPEKFTAENRLYFYAVRLLIERLSWYCRDHRRRDDAGDGSAELIFSNRASLDYKGLAAYLKHLEDNRLAFDYRADTTVIRPAQIATLTHGRRVGLQVADAVASSYFYAVEPSPYGLTEDAYARLLLPRVYRHNGQLWGYGLKLMPREVEEKRRAGVVLKDLERGETKEAGPGP